MNYPVGTPRRGDCDDGTSVARRRSSAGSAGAACPLASGVGPIIEIANSGNTYRGGILGRRKQTLAPEMVCSAEPQKTSLSEREGARGGDLGARKPVCLPIHTPPEATHARQARYERELVGSIVDRTASSPRSCGNASGPRTISGGLRSQAPERQARPRLRHAGRRAGSLSQGGCAGSVAWRTSRIRGSKSAAVRATER